MMNVQDIRVFISCKDFTQSKAFYQALGFKMQVVSENLAIFQVNNSSFFLQRFYNE